MHKKIVEAISDAISHHDKELKMFRIFVMPQETGGFWQMCIVFEPKYEHLINHIELIGKSIGSFYGEGLGVEKTKKYIIFS